MDGDLLCLLKICCTPPSLPPMLSPQSLPMASCPPDSWSELLLKDERKSDEGLGALLAMVIITSMATIFLDREQERLVMAMM